MTPKDGGPAFPTPIPNVTRGMSLRDHFAGQAMLGQLSLLAGVEKYEVMWETLAKSSYGLADAMLAERAKGGSDAS